MVVLAQSATQAYRERAQIVSDCERFKDEPFDCLVALEVLEHIEDDAAALKLWRTWLKPGGLIVLSVPAHMRHWTAADDAGGHYRRYERDGLNALMHAAGITIELSWNFGFPLTAATVPARRLLYRAPVRGSAGSRTAVSALDSVRRIPAGGRAAEWLGEAVGTVMHFCQLPFLESELGDGYMIVGRASEGFAEPDDA
jgi:SAM-dependent methyltransferase